MSKGDHWLVHASKPACIVICAFFSTKTKSDRNSASKRESTSEKNATSAFAVASHFSIVESFRIEYDDPSGTTQITSHLCHVDDGVDCEHDDLLRPDQR